MKRYTIFQFVILNIFIVVFLFGIKTSIVQASTLNVPTNFLSLNSGLVGWWTFDGKDTPWTSSTTATTLDKSGNGNTGTLTNMNQATAPVTGKVGQGLKFDGVNNSVSLTNNLYNSLSQGTITGWIKLSSLTPIGSINCPIFALGGNSLSYSLSYFRLIDGVTTGTRLQYMGDSNNRYLYGNTQFLRDVWYHVSVTSDGLNNKLYVNGSPESSVFGGVGTPSDGFWFNDTTDTTMRYRIGIVPRSTGDIGPCNGTLDDVRIYNRALSASEITQLYNTGSASHTGTLPSTQATSTCTSGLTCGLVGYWTLDGKDTYWTASTTATTLDKSGNGNTGTLTNMNQKTAPVTGKVGQGLVLNGINQYINVNNSASLNITTNTITVSAWVKATSPGTAKYIVSKNTAGGTGYALYTGSSGNAKFFINNGSFKPTADVGNIIWDNKWHLLSGTYDGVNVSIYVDGKFNNQVAATGNQADTSSYSLYIGELSNSPGASDYFPGSIDDIRIYNRALSAAEVLGLYNSESGNHSNVSQSGQSNLSSGLIGWWTLDGKDTPWTSSSAATTLDKSGNGNTGTLTSMNQSTAPVTGKVGQGLKFDGSILNYINIPNSSSIVDLPNGAMSVSTWIKVNNDGTNDYLFTKSLNIGSSGWLFQLDQFRRAKFQIHRSTTSLVSLTNASTMPVYANGWFLLTVTYPGGDTASNVHIYVNGKEVSAGYTDGVGTYPSDSGSPLKFARSDFNSYANVRLDDVRIYNRVLSATDVLNLYNMTK